MFERVSCRCCSYVTLSRRGQFEVCEVCRWIDDPASDLKGGPNRISLHQGRLNFEAFGACLDEKRPEARRPYPHEFPI